MDRFKWTKNVCREKKVLDIGACGHSRNMKKEDWVHEKIRQVSNNCVGLDINRELVSQWKERGYDMRYGDAEDFSLDKKNFDVVYAGSTIEHLSNPGLFLKCAREHLRDNGIIAINTPNAKYLKKDSFLKEGHVQLYLPELLKRLIERKGFSCKRIVYLDQEETPTMLGKIYVSLFLRIKPDYAVAFGVEGVKK